MRIIAITTAAAMMAYAAYGSIQVPAESEPYQPIVATVVTAMPDGATFSGGWKADAGTKYIKVKDGEIHIWAVPGKHGLSYTGYWVHTESVTFKDGDGNKITIQSFLGSGFINEEAGFEVSGDTPTPPDPTPTPSPIPVAGLKVMIVTETNKPLPSSQQAMVNSTIWRERVGQGNWKVLDPDAVFRGESIWKTARAATAERGVPRLIISNHPKGGYVGNLPENLDALMELIDRLDGESGGGRDE